MSYEKAMKHARNVRKSRKQANMHFGFDTGSGQWASGYSNPEIAARKDIALWFSCRNDGKPEKRAHARECIRERIATLRRIVENTDDSTGRAA